jgi:hypothetical protein
MNRRGIPTAPATCQQCEFNPQFCWYKNHKYYKFYL